MTSTTCALRLSALLVMLAIVPSHGAVAASGIEGTWVGGGYVLPKSGERQSVRCRVRYAQQSSTVFSVSATCSSTTTDVVQTGEVLEASTGRFVGDFYNPQFDISGRIRIQMAGNRQTVTFSGAQGHGSLSLTKQ